MNKKLQEAYFASNYKSGDEALQEAGVVGNLFAIIASIPIPGLWPAWRAAGALLSDANRKCGVFRISNERDACKIKVQIKSSEEKIKILQKAMSGCSKISKGKPHKMTGTKKVKKCEKLIGIHLKKENKKVEKYRSRLRKQIIRGKGLGSASKPSDKTKLI